MKLVIIMLLVGELIESKVDLFFDIWGLYFSGEIEKN